MTTFSFANLDAWARQTEARMDAVVKGSTQEVCRIAQTPKTDGGRMPVDVGTLRNSFQSSLNGSTALKGGESYVLIVGNMKAGDVAKFEWTVEYAKRVNYGFVGEDKLGRTYNQKGAHFLEGAAMQWPSIVAGEVAKAQAAVARNAG